jgi:hypothetical protein
MGVNFHRSHYGWRLIEIDSNVNIHSHSDVSVHEIRDRCTADQQTRYCGSGSFIYTRLCDSWHTKDGTLR